MIDDVSHFSRQQALTSSRRKFLRNSGGLAALGAFPGVLHAATQKHTIQKNNSQKSNIQKYNGKQKPHIDAMVVFRQEDKHSTVFARSLNKQGLTVTPLQLDLVRQWRDGLGNAVCGKNNSAIIGLTNWSDFLMMRELAGEARKFPLVEVQLSGNQYNRPRVLNQYAQQLLMIAAYPKNKGLQNKVNRLSSNDTRSRSLFAWVIV